MIRKLFLYVVYFAIIIVMIVAIVRDFRSHAPKSTSSKPHATQSQPATKKPATTPPKKPAKKESSSSSKAQSSKPKTGTSVSTNAGSTATTSLANSGPGSAVAIFVGATVLGTLSFSWYQRRQLVDRP